MASHVPQDNGEGGPMAAPRSWPVFWAEGRSEEEWSAVECHASSPVAEQLAALLPALPASQLRPESEAHRTAIQEVWAAAQRQVTAQEAQRAVQQVMEEGGAPSLQPPGAAGNDDD